MGYIFISYSHEDKDYAHKLYQHLFEQGLDSWIDDRLDYGSRWSREVERRIRECAVFILIMSPNSKESMWVENEINLARRLDKTIYALLLEGEAWWDFSSLQYVDVKNKEAPPRKFILSLSYIISQVDARKHEVSINVGGNVQGNIIIGNNNVAQFEIDRKASEQAELDRKAREKAEADKKAREQAVLDRIIREKAEADKKAREQAELDRKAREIMRVTATHSETWEFGTRQVVYGAIGAVLYGAFSWITNVFPLPAAGNVTFRPAVAVLIFFGAAYGPLVGLLAGFIGNTLADAISGWGFYWNWSLGNGLIGLFAGLVMTQIKDFRAKGDIIKAVIYGLFGNAVGMLFSALTEAFISGIDLNIAMGGYFEPAFTGNAVMTVLLLPLLMVIFKGIKQNRRL